ncbi:hypothetical protein EDC01DRAFT_723898 [Geopyxis carbonaria]|nr:hypothetical protein EDC01DRAFT_723898 [Geopyxis carbonaria]
MPSAIPRKRPTPEPDSLGAESNSEPSSTESTKRARILEHQSDEDEDEDEDEDNVDGEMGGNILPEAELEEEEEVLGSDVEIEELNQAFEPGAIIRIKLVNFVTYSDVEFRPGPSLNMVIGPNGTGKSTMVCAICLGLGWQTSNLGRAKDVSEFVKHGAPEAEIEIELQGREDERNPVFRRKIFRENNSSSWWINGKQSNATKVIKLAKEYNIQIDNLCQFLPQDRVSEFAHLSFTEKLKETQRAAAPPEMLKSHEDLQLLGKQLRKATDDLVEDRRQHGQLLARQEVLQADVDRLRERDEVMTKIDLLGKAKPFINYREARTKAHEAKYRARKAKEEVVALEREVAPAMERPKQKQKYRDAIKNCVLDRKELFKEKEKELSRIKDQELPKYEDKIKDLSVEVESAHKRETNRREEVQKLKQKIENTKKKLEQGPPEFDIAHYNSLMQEKNREIRGWSQKLEELRMETTPIQEQGKKITRDIERAQTELGQLDSIAGQRMETLRRVNADAYKVMQWLGENGNLFQKEVYGPAILNCTVKNPAAVDAVEGVISSLATAFTCQTRDDYNTMTREVFGSKRTGEAGLGVANVTLKELSGTRYPTLASWPAPRVSNQELAGYGFDGYVLSYIEGPEPVLNMFCHEAQANTTPIALRDIGSKNNKKVEESGSITNWISGRSSYRAMRRYGVLSTRIQNINRAKMFNVQPVDFERKREIQQNISMLKDEFDELKNELSQRQKQAGEWNAELNTAKQEKSMIDGEKMAKQSALNRYHRTEAEVAGWIEDLAVKGQGAEEYRQKIAKLEAELEKHNMNRATVALKFAKRVVELVELNEEFVKMQLRYIEAESDVVILEEANRAIVRQLKQKREEAEDLSNESARLREIARQRQDALSVLVVSLSEEQQAFLQSIPTDKSIRDIDEEIEAEEARLSLIHEGNPNAIRQFEERAKKIQMLEEKLAKGDRSVAELQKAIDEIRSVWEPGLDALIAKISTAFSKSFEKIGCAGEVRVFKSEEGFEKWAIEILVRFRESEKLQVLDAQRQSGGERAVSTVFYLMALQSMARSPFRVVDEINQGMDPRNERVVHHRMVNIACQQHTSQYFLITPKLLGDLTYHPRMKVNCIYSGDWVQQSSVADHKKYFAGARRLKAAAAARA